MLKYHVAVCDDEKSDLDGIVQSVQQYDVQGCFDIETYMDGNELLSELQMQKKSFDLLLLDIEMPSNGFQLAQSLIQMEKHPLVVFVTKRHEYAVQGYGIAFRYLVKPLDQTLFAAAMDSDASWGSTVDLCRFFKPDTNSARSPGLTFFQPKRKCSAHPMAVANHCNPSRKHRGLLCSTVSCCG